MPTIYFNGLDSADVTLEKKSDLKKIWQKFIYEDKDFVVEIKENSTKKQLKGFFRIATLLAPYMQESFGIFFDKEMVKEFVKQEANFCTMIKGRVITKSLTKATKEEMHLMIDKLYELGEFFNVKDYKLTSKEKEDLVEYYNKN